jgi:hypothetical protein
VKNSRNTPTTFGEEEARSHKNQNVAPHQKISNHFSENDEQTRLMVIYPK